MADIVYVQRNGGGRVTGIYANRQPGIAEEALATDHADIATFKAARETPVILVYRRQREAAYMRELTKPEETAPNYNRTLGDVLDIIITQMEADRLVHKGERTAEYATMLGKIAAIKQRFPKPT